MNCWAVDCDQRDLTGAIGRRKPTSFKVIGGWIRKDSSDAKDKVVTQEFTFLRENPDVFLM